jgi:hypothetical protein
MSEDKRFSDGAELARRLFAGAACGAPLPDDLRRYTRAHLLGDVWRGSALALRDRPLITCAVLLALGREAEVAPISGEPEISAWTAPGWRSLSRTSRTTPVGRPAPAASGSSTRTGPSMAEEMKPDPIPDRTHR